MEEKDKEYMQEIEKQGLEYFAAMYTAVGFGPILGEGGPTTRGFIARDADQVKTYLLTEAYVLRSKAKEAILGRHHLKVMPLSEGTVEQAKEETQKDTEEAEKAKEEAQRKERQAREQAMRERQKQEEAQIRERARMEEEQGLDPAIERARKERLEQEAAQAAERTRLEEERRVRPASWDIGLGGGNRED